jgi:hypothetical protein
MVAIPPPAAGARSAYDIDIASFLNRFKFCLTLARDNRIFESFQDIGLPPD